MSKQKQIFRKEAMDRMSSPEQLDELMPVTSARGWIALSGISVLLVMAVIWGFAGRIDTTVNASGVLLRPGAVYAVKSSKAGFVETVFVESGDEVKKNDKLIKLSGEEPIIAKEDGRVLAVSVIREDHVNANIVLLTMEAPEEALQAVFYVPAKDGYQLAPKMKVLVHPVTGGDPILGTVIKAGRFPATRTAMQRTLQNQEWGAEVLQQGPVLEIVVDLDPNTAAEVIRNLMSGTPCGATITVSSRSPVSFVLPIFE